MHFDLVVFLIFKYLYFNNVLDFDKFILLNNEIIISFIR